MSFPYAKDTQLRWELIAEERQIRALLEKPELFDRPTASHMVLGMYVRTMELLRKINEEDHIDTVMLYRHLFEKIMAAQSDAILLYTTFAIRALEKLGVEHRVLQRMEHLRLLLAQQDYVGITTMLREFQEEALPAAPAN